MGRVHIDLPSSIAFETELSLRITDINYGGHLANDAVLSIAHEARIRFLQSLGYSEMDIEGKSLIMTDAAIVYKSQGYHRDNLKIQIGLTSFSKIGFDMVYIITNKISEKEVARVKTGLAFFNYHTNRLVAVPEQFLLYSNTLKK